MVRGFFPAGNFFFFLAFRASALSGARSPAKQEDSLLRWDCSRRPPSPPPHCHRRETPIYANPGDKPAPLGFSDSRFRTEEIGYVRCLSDLVLKIRRN